MPKATMKDLLQAGVHFGHQTRRWNPKMKRFIFAERGGVYILDLRKTVECIDEAREAARKTAAEGKAVLFVGTKRQAKETVEEEAKRCGMFYVSQRWLGGMLTNFQTIRKSVARLEELERMEEDGTFEAMTKREVLKLKVARRLLEASSPESQHPLKESLSWQELVLALTGRDPRRCPKCGANLVVRLLLVPPGHEPNDTS